MFILNGSLSKEKVAKTIEIDKVNFKRNLNKLSMSFFISFHLHKKDEQSNKKNGQNYTNVTVVI